MKERLYIFFSFLFLFIYFFLVFNTNFQGPDQPVYFAYTESVVEDGDLNVVNNIGDSNYFFPSGIKNVSKTYNFPDFHNHGGVLLWVPFYKGAKNLSYLSQNLDLFNIKTKTHIFIKQIINCFMSFSTVIFGFFTLVLSFLLCNIFFSAKISLFSTLIICFGTPFFYFLLYEVGNAQIIASLFSVSSIWAASFIIRMKKSHFLIYGLFFGICLVVKADIWAQFFFICFLFAFLLKSKKTNLLNIVFFLLGLVPAITFKIINDYIKYGTFHIGEINILTPHMSYLKEMLFSSYRGYLYTSPILFICLVGFILVLINYLKPIITISEANGNSDALKRDIFILLLGSYLIIKIFIISRTYAWGGGTPGARVLLTEFPVFVLLFARTISCKSNIKNLLIFTVSIIFIFWNMLLISEYLINIDLQNSLSAPKLLLRIKSIEKMFIFLFQVKDISIKLYFCLLLVPIVFIITCYILIVANKVKSSFWYKREGFNKKAFITLSVTAITLNIFYGMITFSNVKNNKNNVNKLNNVGFFTTTKILSKRDYEKKENVGAMKEMILYFTYKGDIERAAKIQKDIKDIYGDDK
ncbi:MAG: hypothetical protein A2Y03_04820 [Omnitrophica WOR_2 bacterium GWF2_38_59]|nr:MAG: hypothetical protein A2Y03_04820 [Omnitrophica WOR_2 bacterium GWF2_38_59]OGX55479.1 MAG: hypothetical protein A2447_03255 [Omnitrophica WOR_2 bacterium RIFOXYC2_FULL_38_12]